jgi:putative DNA primase/helicase
MNKTSVSPNPTKTFHEELGLDYECSEVGNMHRFIDQNVDRIRYIPEQKKWAVWDDTRWCLSSHSQVYQYALDTAKSIYNEARDCRNEEGRTRLTKWVLSCQNDRKIQSMINMASKIPEMQTKQNEFDAYPHLINCKNGIVDLRTSELIGRSSEDRVMKRVSVNYTRHAKCPTFINFLHQIFNGDKGLISWIQRALGYTLTGLTTEQVLFIAHGRGANGKSTLFETVLDILGDYGRSAEFETFLASDKSNTRVLEGLGKLRGMRFALASETDSTRRFSESVIKKVTGGDTLTGGALYCSAFQFQPQFKLWLLANHLPAVSDASHGFWRRVKIIPFARKFTANEIDQNMRSKLMNEAEGIFAWCVRGARNWHQLNEQSGGTSGLGKCHAIDEAVEDYRHDQDTLSEFFSATLDNSTDGSIPAGDLYSEYHAWAKSSDQDQVCSQIAFGKKMAERGIAKTRTKKGIVYTGIRLKA